MRSLLSDLSILAVLIASGEALNRKSSRGADDQGPDDYHPAHLVPRGECTKLLKPELFFIGQPYSGSTSLADLMIQHPEMSFGDTKEHQHFYKPLSEIGSREARAQYLEEFWVSCKTTVAFDASMNTYFMGLTPGEYSDSELIERIKNFRRQMGSDVKIIMMIRDPVDHLFSAECNRRQGDLLAGRFMYLLQRSNQTHRPLDVTNPPNISSTWWRSTAMLQAWFEVFPEKNNFKFFSSDDFFGSPQKTLDELFNFVGVAPKKFDSATFQEKGDGGRRRCSLKATPEERRAYWSVKDNMENKAILEEMTGLHFSWDTKDT